MTIDSLRSSAVLKLMFCCGIAVLSALLVRTIIRFSHVTAAEPGEISAQLVTENGFRFEKIVNDPNLWLGPKIGYLLDARNLEDQQQQPLAAFVENENLTMLLAVDRQCQVCSRSIEYIKEVKGQLAQRGIKYCFVSFKADAPEDYFTFTKRLDVDSPSFLWVHRKAIAPSEPSLMIVPTHLLVDRQHRIRGIWPGGAAGKTLRDKMVHQIITDIDTFLSDQQKGAY